MSKKNVRWYKKGKNKRIKMNVSVTIYKEKKEKDFRMVILP